MQESTPGSYADPAPPPSSSTSPLPSSQQQQQQQQQRQQQQRENPRSNVEDTKKSDTEDDSYDNNSSSDASYTETFNSDLEEDEADPLVPLQASSNSLGSVIPNPYGPSYVPHQPDFYRFAPYYPPGVYTMPPTYPAIGLQPPLAGSNQQHSRQHVRQPLQGEPSWAIPDMRYYGDQPQQPYDPQYGTYRGGEQYGTSVQRGTWSQSPQSARSADYSRPHVDVRSEGPEWESRQQQAPHYLGRPLGMEHQQHVQYERPGENVYLTPGRLLDLYPSLQRSRWLREMAPTAERLEQLISQFPSLVRNMTVAADGPGQQNPNIYSRLQVNTTLWESETTVCIVVEVDQRSVSRRCDNNMINGTKLLNVARISRGRRDGILKGEKIRKVVKVGAMNNKGVWIPFERALEIAQREEILDSLYPLFVADLTPLLYSPSNLSRLRQLLSKGVRKNPEFQRWFEGIPPLYNPQSPMQSQLIPQPLHPSQQASASYPQSSGFQIPSQTAAGPGPSSTVNLSRSHHRTRSQQAMYKGSAIQKQQRQRRSYFRGHGSHTRYSEDAQISAESAGNLFHLQERNLPRHTQSHQPSQQAHERRERDLGEFQEQPHSQSRMPSPDSDIPPTFHPASSS